jgi:hypothetical protein
LWGGWDIVCVGDRGRWEPISKERCVAPEWYEEAPQSRVQRVEERVTPHRLVKSLEGRPNPLKERGEGGEGGMSGVKMNPRGSRAEAGRRE